MSSFIWPTRDEYDVAFTDWKHTLKTPPTNGSLARDDLNNIDRPDGANLYVCLYKIGDFMYRCFCANPPHQPPADIRERYRAVARFCQSYQGAVSPLLPIVYDEAGIQVSSRSLPVVTLPYLHNTLSLGEFIRLHHEQPDVMTQLSQAWYRLMQYLLDIHMAHGDLDLTNVFVIDSNGQLGLKLIDYDNVWIPALKSYPQTEYGHTNFRHPVFVPPMERSVFEQTDRFPMQDRPFNATMDRFSALVIYLSLQVLRIRSSLYRDWGATETSRLIFSREDYVTIDRPDNHIQQLRTWCEQDPLFKPLTPFVYELIHSLTLESVYWAAPRPLEEILLYPPLAPNFSPPKSVRRYRRPPVMIFSEAVFDSYPEPPKESSPPKWRPNPTETNRYPSGWDSGPLPIPYHDSPPLQPIEHEPIGLGLCWLILALCVIIVLLLAIALIILIVR